VMMKVKSFWEFEKVCEIVKLKKKRKINNRAGHEDETWKRCREKISNYKKHEIIRKHEIETRGKVKKKNENPWKSHDMGKDFF
jgi:hypothetical protein